MEAVLLVGGQGTRLRPLTITTPKPMLPVAGLPCTTHQIARAREAGVTRIVLGTSYRAEVFREHFGDGEGLGVELVYAVEDEPLGTGGAIRHAAEHLRSGPDEPVLVFNGDVLAGLDIDALVARHVAADADVTLYLTDVDDPRPYGLVPTGPDGRVTAFLEKPQTPEEIVTSQINAGCYVFRRSVIDDIPAGRVVSVERETFPGLLAQDAVVLGVVDPGYWLDLGTPLAFVQGSRDLVTGLAPSPCVTLTGDFLALDGSRIEPGGRVTGGTVVGRRSLVAAEAVVDGSVLFDDVVIGRGAVVRDSIVGEGAVIEAGATIVGSVVGDGARIGSGNELRDGARVWPGAHITDTAIRFSSDR